MRFEDREIVLKDGRKCILRPTSPEYADQMIEYLKKTSAETPFLLRNPDEVGFTLESVPAPAKSVAYAEQSHDKSSDGKQIV